MDHLEGQETGGTGTSGPGWESMEKIVWAGRTISQLSEELGVAPEVLRMLICLVNRAEATAAGVVVRLVPESSVHELASEVEQLRRRLGRGAISDGASSGRLFV